MAIEDIFFKVISYDSNENDTLIILWLIQSVADVRARIKSHAKVAKIVHSFIISSVSFEELSVGKLGKVVCKLIFLMNQFVRRFSYTGSSVVLKQTI